ncbi:Xenobiotic-transporting ATPase [Actinobacteria bacterium OK074]|nr:Xenobiotic-transporting ATPase [Actinobacteria bacterium OK074]
MTARGRRGVAVRLALWSLLETGQTFLLGYALARALDSGFLAGRAPVGLAWLGAAGGAVAVGALGTARVYGAVAALVEPLRDRWVERVVARGVREADGSALSGLTQQVEIARDTFAGLVMVARSFLFTAVGALVGLFSLAPALLLVVAPPLAAGVALCVVSLRPLARRQEAFLVADEAIADRLGRVCPGLRDVTAFGAQEQTAAEVGACVDAELRAARSLARWGALRVASLAVGGQLPVVLLLATAPWLLDHGVTAGGLVGALAYVTQSLLPALQSLVHGLGTSGTRLRVVLRRLDAGLTATGAPRRGPVERGTDTEGPGDAAGCPSDGRTGLATAAPVHRRPPPPLRPAPDALVVRSLTFAYGPGAVPVVEDLDLAVPAGSSLAVVGPSGIGKSTLAALVAGVLRPRAGSVRVYGHPVPGPAAHAARVLIPQEAYVFTGTFRDNLVHLRSDPVSEAEVRAAAEAVGLTALLDRAGGPAAEIAPATLSAGERQLVALTRAYLSPASLVLLDEATSHLDPEAEDRAERAFAGRPGTTLVVIAHRTASARRADRVLVMDGRRTSYGTHEALLAHSPHYRDLVGAWTPAGPGGVGSEPPLPLGDPDGVDTVAGPGLAGDGGHVVAYGSVGQMETPGDLRDGGPLRGQG